MANDTVKNMVMVRYILLLLVASIIIYNIYSNCVYLRTTNNTEPFADNNDTLKDKVKNTANDAINTIDTISTNTFNKIKKLF
jgi:hypothetical protein